jgi:hypothetical protein
MVIHSNSWMHLTIQVVYALRLGQAYVPFRQGKASILLKESLGGNCKTVVMICLWLEDCFYNEAVHFQHLTNKIYIEEMVWKLCPCSLTLADLKHKMNYDEWSCQCMNIQPMGAHKIIGATKHVTCSFFMESSLLRLENFEIMKKSYVSTI